MTNTPRFGTQPKLQKLWQQVRSQPRNVGLRSRFVDESVACALGDQALLALEDVALELTQKGQQQVAEGLLEHMAAMKIALDAGTQDEAENHGPTKSERARSRGGAPLAMPDLFGRSDLD